MVSEEQTGRRVKFQLANRRDVHLLLWPKPFLALWPGEVSIRSFITHVRITYKPSIAALAAMLSVRRAYAKLFSVIVSSMCFFILCLPMNLPHGDADRIFALQRLASSQSGRDDFIENLLCRLEQLFTLIGQQRITTDDQSFAKEISRNQPTMMIVNPVA